MRFDFFVAFRYLFSKKSGTTLGRISVISVLTVMLAVAIPLLVLSVLNGFHESIGTKIIGTKYHIRLDYQQQGFKDYQKYCDMLNDMKEVQYAMPYFEGQALIRTQSYDQSVIVRGIRPGDIEKAPLFYNNIQVVAKRVDYGDPDRYKAFQEIDITGCEDITWDTMQNSIYGENIFEGTTNYVQDFFPDMTYCECVYLPQFFAQINPYASSFFYKEDCYNKNIAIGEALGNNLRIYPVSYNSIVIPPRPSNPSPESFPIIVKSSFSAGYGHYDTSMIYMDLKYFQYIYNLDDVVSTIGIYLKDDDMAFDFARRLGKDSRFDNFDISNTLNEGIFIDFNREKDLMFIVLVIMILAAFLTIYITLNVIVIEKKKEIGILKSLGVTVQSIRRIFLYQGFIVGVVGSIFGLILGTLLTISLIDFINLAEFIFNFSLMPADVFYMNQLPYDLQFTDMIIQTSGAIFVSVLASYFPARKASLQRPVEVLRRG